MELMYIGKHRKMKWMTHTPNYFAEKIKKKKIQ